MLPGDYGFGTHRVPLETGYYDVFNRDTIELVDVKEATIECFTEAGLKTTIAEYPLDIINLATGFDAATGALTRMNITGRDGVSLTEEWSKNIRSTLGLQIDGFPNLFTVAELLAPAAAFCNMTTCLQQQVDWITDCIAFVRREGKNSIDRPGRDRMNGSLITTRQPMQLSS